jgi:hypothetical protein
MLAAPVQGSLRIVLQSLQKCFDEDSHVVTYRVSSREGTEVEWLSIKGGHATPPPVVANLQAFRSTSRKSQRAGRSRKGPETEPHLTQDTQERVPAIQERA